MSIPRINKEQLKDRLDADEAAAPVLVDVRLKYPYEHSTVKLPGAVRLAPPDFEFSALPHDRDIVTYDSDPEEIVSAAVTARLIRKGYRASALRGSSSPARFTNLSSLSPPFRNSWALVLPRTSFWNPTVCRPSHS